MQSSATGWVGKIRKISQAQERLGFGAGCKPEVMISCEATSNNPKVASSMSYPEGWRSRAGRILSPVRTIPTYHMSLRATLALYMSSCSENPEPQSEKPLQGQGRPTWSNSSPSSCSCMATKTSVSQCAQHDSAIKGFSSETFAEQVLKSSARNILESLASLAKTLSNASCVGDDSAWHGSGTHSSSPPSRHRVMCGCFACLFFGAHVP